MGADLSTVDELLKIDYIDGVRDLIRRKNVLLARLQSHTEYTSGKTAYVPLHTSRNHGIGSRFEDEDLPTAGNQGYTHIEFGMPSHYGAIRVTGQSIAASREEAGAYLMALESELKGMSRDLARDDNRQLFCPKSGRLCTILVTAGGTSVDGATTLGASVIEVDTNLYIEEGLIADILDTVTSTYTVHVTRTITDISPVVNVTTGATNYRVTLSGAPTSAAAGDFLVRTGSAGREMFGLPDIISAGNPADIDSSFDLKYRYYGGKDRTSPANKKLRGNVIAFDALFNTSAWRSAMDTIDRYSDGDPSIIITSYAIFNYYAESMLVDRRINTTGSRFDKLDGGWDMLDFDGVPVVKEDHCPDDESYVLSEDRLGFYTMGEWDWIDDDGLILRKAPGKDAFAAELRCYREFGSDDPADHARITGILTA